VGLGRLGRGEPPVHVGDAVGRDRVALALRPCARLDAVDGDETALQEPGERRVDLPVGERAVAAE